MASDPMQVLVGEQHRGCRLDNFLQQLFPQYSRTRLQNWIRKGLIRIDDHASKPSAALRPGQRVTVQPQPLPSLRARAEEIPLEIVYEDQDVIAVNKPAGMVVHAGAGRHSGTLVNALLHRFGALSTAGGEERPGIVHRIDRGTSGVLLIARNDLAHRRLAAQFAAREVGKTYLALVQGVVAADQGRIERPVSRDPVRRTRMTTRISGGRTALTWWTVLKRYLCSTYLKVGIGTGRTHQIRVHFASIGHPVAGDNLYGATASEFGRFFLHSHRIEFRQPTTGVPVIVEAPLPPELAHWLSSVSATPVK